MMSVKTGSWLSVLFVVAIFLILFSTLGLLGSISTDLGSSVLEIVLVLGLLIILSSLLRRRR